MKNKRILLAEDFDKFGRDLKEDLEKHGFSVHWIASGLGILPEIITSHYDIVIMDIGESDYKNRPFGLAEKVRDAQPSALLIGQTAYREIPCREEAENYFDKVYSKFESEKLPKRIKK